MGTRLNHLTEAVLTYTHNLCFDRMYQEMSIFLSSKNDKMIILDEKMAVNCITMFAYDKKIKSAMIIEPNATVMHWGWSYRKTHNMFSRGN